MTKHSHINSNKQIKDKVQPSALKSTTGFGVWFVGFFLVDVKETGVEEKQACRNFAGNFKPRLS